MKTSKSMRILPAAATLGGLLLAAGADSVPGPLTSPVHGIDLAAIDHSVQPGVDFFRYANGNLLKSTQIPPDRSNYGNGAVLVELTNDRLRKIIEGAQSGSDSGSAQARQIGD